MNNLYARSTYAVFGDVHAHIKPLALALEKLGWNPETFAIPKNLTIVQLGDLIHKGPWTSEIIEFVDQIMTVNNDDPAYGSWIQLMGNHESQYFAGTPKFWPFEADTQSTSILRGWVDNGRMKNSYVIEQDNGKPYVITHAGVNPFWYNCAELVLQGHNLMEEMALFADFRKHQSPERFSQWLNSFSDDPSMVVWAGDMLYGKYDHRASPIWAETVREVYVQWWEEEIPFHQIHGHVTPYNWRVNKFFSLVPPFVQKDIQLFKKKRRTLWINSDGSEFYGIDNGFDKTADLEFMRPLMLDSSGVLESDKCERFFAKPQR